MLESIQKFKETGDPRYIIKNELDKDCFQHDMTYGDFKDLARRTDSDKVLRGKPFNIAKNPRFDGYQRGLASMIYTFFDTTSASLVDKSAKGSGFNSAIKQSQRLLDLATQQLAEKLTKPIIRKFKKRKVYSSFKDNIWAADTHLPGKFIKGMDFLLCVITSLGYSF